MIGALLIAAVGGTLATPPADSAPSPAETLYFHCQRYESQCSGNDCYRIADGLRADTERKLLTTVQKLESVEYRIAESAAEATLDNAAPNAILTRNNKYVIRYENVDIGPNLITVEDKTGSGIVKEKVEIDKLSGFYADYIIHTDNTIRDVPIGEPYTAYFGWCEDVNGGPAPSAVPAVLDNLVPAATPAPPAAPVPATQP